MKNETVHFSDDGQIVAKNIEAYWLPDVFIRREIGGTVYTVTGSYDGTELLNKKLLRVMTKNGEDCE